MTASASHTLVTEPPVWLITGCSTGFGREIAKLAIERGFRTVTTARNPFLLEDLAAAENALILELDVTKPDQVADAMRSAEARFGGVDVLINNAGIGYFGAVEESDEAEIRKMFEVNFFGTSRMIHAVLPGMRQRRRGVIVNFSSIGGLRSFPAVGYYNATKFAVEGLSEALWQEVEPLGIQVMVVEPSGFRTDWAGRSANEATLELADYVATAGLWRTQVREISGKQAGDPVRDRRCGRIEEAAAPPAARQRRVRRCHGQARGVAQGLRGGRGGRPIGRLSRSKGRLPRMIQGPTQSPCMAASPQDAADRRASRDSTRYSS
jgi:NAD(P)-dependent dehydrogenase (short-subunit alcohol dehydrogenase family)